MFAVINSPEAASYSSPSGAMKTVKEHWKKARTTEKYDVFLVEDDKDDRILALKTLKKSPYIRKIHFFRTGDDLIEYLDEEGYYSGNLMRLTPTLILLDIHVPGTDGINILKALKHSPVTEFMPVIIITGDQSKKICAEAYQLHANAFINKPLDLEQVHQVIFTGWGWPSGLPPEQ